MIYPGIRKISKELNMYKSSNQTFGYIDDYFIRLGDGQNLKYTIIEYSKQDDNTINTIRELLEEQKKKFKFKKIEINSSSIYLEYSEAFKIASTNRIKNNLLATIEILKQNNIQGDTNCHKCSSEDDLNIYHYNDSGLTLCNICNLNIQNEIESDSYDLKTKDKNYLSGLIGAILLGIPGILVGLLFYSLLDTIAGVTSLVIYGLSMKGYYIFKGNFGKLTPVILLVVTYIYVILGNYLNVYVELIQLEYIHKDIIDILINNSKIKGIINANIVLSVFFSFLIVIPTLISGIKKSIIPKLHLAKKI